MTLSPYPQGTGSHLVTVSTGPTLSDALMSSPVIAGEDGAGAGSGGGFDFVDPNTDPELALALRLVLGIHLVWVLPLECFGVVKRGIFYFISEHISNHQV